jgi:hypothetical protein
MIECQTKDKRFTKKWSLEDLLFIIIFNSKCGTLKIMKCRPKKMEEAMVGSKEETMM